jgi:hypothetical protein
MSQRSPDLSGWTDVLDGAAISPGLHFRRRETLPCTDSGRGLRFDLIERLHADPLSSRLFPLFLEGDVITAGLHRKLRIMGFDGRF